MIAQHLSRTARIHRVNVGLVGAGNISDTHARAARRGRSAHRRRLRRQPRQGPRSSPSVMARAPFDTLDALLARPPLDLVIDRQSVGLSCRSRDRRGTSGTPCAGREAARYFHQLASITLIDEAARAGVTLGVFFQDRLKPDVVEMKRRIDAGEIGTPLLATGEVKWFRPRDYYASSRWRGTWALDGGGALMNQGIHTVDLMLHLLGPVVSVSGLTATRFHAHRSRRHGDRAARVRQRRAWHDRRDDRGLPGSPRRLRIAGTEGSLVLEGDRLIDARGDSATPHAPENAASPVVSDVLASSAHHRRLRGRDPRPARAGL